MNAKEDFIWYLVACLFAFLQIAAVKLNIPLLKYLSIPLLIFIAIEVFFSIVDKDK